MIQSDHAVSREIEAVLDAHVDRVKSAARRYRVSDGDLDLVLQETRLRIWRMMERGTSPSLIGSSLIYRMAAGAAIDVLRRRDARREEPEAIVASLPSRDGSALDRVALREALRGCFAALRQGRRAVVGLHLRGTPREEIASLLRWSEAKTRNLLYRGLDDLRLCLRHAGFEEG
jgi:RNA polymerase sigma factor (sigma-70 family)